MNKQGFTLTELLITVLIVGILTSIALPMYTRTIERSRAAEAMSSIKAMNDSIYAFFTEKERCPTRFSQLAVSIADTNDADSDDNTILTKFFRFDLAGAPVAVSGTDGRCNGVLATRIHGGRYEYMIWNPYTRGTTGNSLSLQCSPVVGGAGESDSRALCESLGLYRGDVTLGNAGGD